MAEQLTLVLVTHERKILEEQCDSVTIPGSGGYLGVLPGHTPLISTLSPGTLTYESGGKSHRWVLDAGFCEVSNDVVTVLADAARLPADVDLAEAEAMRDEAQQGLVAAEVEKVEAALERLALAEAWLDAASRKQ